MKKTSTRRHADHPAERPDFLGMAEPAIRATRTPRGEYTASLILSERTATVGTFADCPAALAAARVALNAALDAEAGI